MNIHLFLLLPDWRSRVRSVLPRISEAKLDAMAALIAANRFVTDDGHAHPDLAALFVTQPQKETQ